MRAHWLLRTVRVVRAIEILLLGGRIPASRALEIRLVTQVAPRPPLAALDALVGRLPDP